MGQAASDLSTEEVDDSSQPTLGIANSVRRRRTLPRLEYIDRSDSREGVNNEDDTQQRPDGRSTGGGRYNLRVRPNTTSDSTAATLNSNMSDRNNSDPDNEETSPDAQDSSSQRRTDTGDSVPIGVRRQGSSILRVERATLRSVLAVLTGRFENDDDDSDESDGRRHRGRRRFDGMRMHNQDENEDGSSSGSATSDDEEWVRRIAGISRGASFTRRRRRNSSKGSRRMLRADSDVIQLLNKSDFSAMTRQSLGMSPYPKQIPAESTCPVIRSSNSKSKLMSYVDKCRRSVDMDESEEDVDVETINATMDNSKEDNNTSGECSTSSRSKRECSTSPSGPKLDASKPSFRSSITSVSECNRLPTVSSWVSSRELGNFARSPSSGSPFSHGRQCFMMTKFLPNKRRKIATFNQKLFCGSYSNDGNLFLSACQDQNIRIFDTSQAKFRHRRIIRARDVGWSVLDTAISPDNRHLIYSSWCDYIYQVNLYGPDGQMIRSDKLPGVRNTSNDEDNTIADNHQALNLAARDGGDRFCIFSMRFSQDGDEILCGAKDGYIYVYDRGSNQRSLRVDAHEDDVNAVAFIDSATHILASGGDDGICKIWDRRALRETDPVPVGVLAGHIDGITYIDPKGDGRHLITNRYSMIYET